MSLSQKYHRLAVISKAPYVCPQIDSSPRSLSPPSPFLPYPHTLLPSPRDPGRSRTPPELLAFTHLQHFFQVPVPVRCR